jgi:RNA-directed DNA polymerase
MVATKLQRIAEKARTEPNCRFTSLFHLMNVDMLRECFRELRKDAAAGIDKVTKEEYGRNLEENLKALVGKLHRMSFIPLPVRRVYIPKPGSGKKRPLGIPALEDKLVQSGLARILAVIYEADFIEDSYGFRPGRGCHDALRALSKEVEGGRVHYIVDADIKAFLETSSYYTSFHERFSKRVGWVFNTLIRRPFLFPVRRWTAESSPRFTRCNTVCLDRPSILVASCMGT